MDNIKQRLAEFVEQHRERLLSLTQELIRRPSQNTSPEGSEGACQEYIVGVLRQAGYEPDIYELDGIEGLLRHPLATPGRRYSKRPNVAAKKNGAGGGRSLILSGHIDTVPRGQLPWTRDSFGGQIEGNRLYGRGSNDMKAGVAINLFAFEALAAMNVELKGDVTFESIVDEEFGGVNGTLAGRLRGYTADAAILAEPSSLRICAGQRGGRTVHLLFSADGGVLGNIQGGSVVDQITYFLNSLTAFAQQRRAACRPHVLYANSSDPVPVTVTKITTGPWGTGEPITIPEQGRVELYWQLMPGEQQEEVDREFMTWFDGMIRAGDTLLARRPELSFAVRWLPGSAIEASSPLCMKLSQASNETLGKTPEIAGIEGPCDLFIFHEFGIPAVLWGPAGGKTHGSDEFVEIDTVIDAAKVLLTFICDWCGVA